ncbi:hypothetical protein HPB52_024748 [Rhipicephalus sanguineus]|uniref:Uncharacterized protein n=1 Tax=Rhipicephalus sanguineus TaxID=34632 RepID=A0A9D4PAT5_RHISA|nr:hypothetical protein HPB52_024748 [Rhipicephalus sanguineus]
MNITSLDLLPRVYGNSMEVLRKLVRSVLREQLQKQRLDQNASMISSLADVMREEESTLALDTAHPLAAISTFEYVGDATALADQER